jgi:hypothetical protein
MLSFFTMQKLPGVRLERYTIKRPQEVLVVTADIDGEMDQILIFKGFSSSLMRPTATDPDVPVLPASAQVLKVDRLHSPYRPELPQYIEQGISWDAMQRHLADVGE